MGYAEGTAADNKNMVFSFWGKSSVSGTKMYARWGYSSTYGSVTLTTDWQLYNISLPKGKYNSISVHPYFDKAGIFYINSPVITDGTWTSRFEPETETGIEIRYYTINGQYTDLPTRSREGYTFDGWYTDAIGGTKITKGSNVYHGDKCVYAHWTKTISSTPVKTAVSDSGNKYEFYDNAMSWEEAESFCESKGGHLVTINSSTEKDFVLSLIEGNTRYSWIGAKYNESQKAWSWITGEEFSYTNWAPGEPSSKNGNDSAIEPYAMIHPLNYSYNIAKGSWNDCVGIDNVISYYSWKNSSFICEYEPSQKVELTLHYMNSSSDTSTISYEKDEVIATLPEPAYNGYEFLGWYTQANGGSKIVLPYTITKDTDLYAQWRKIATSVTLSQTNLELIVGKTAVLTATVLPDDAYDKTVTWSTNAPSVASVSNGTITAKAAGKATITVTTSNGKKATCNVTVRDKSLSSISVSKQPDVTTYFVGQELNTTGLQIKLSFDDDSTEYVTSGFTTNGFDSSTAGSRTVTVNYQGKSTSFIVTVKNKSLSSISISKQPNKTTYYVDEALDTTGLQLKLSYDDGSVSYTSTGFIITGFDSATPGTKTVSVQFEGKTSSFAVVVEEIESYVLINGKKYSVKVGDIITYTDYLDTEKSYNSNDGIPGRITAVNARIVYDNTKLEPLVDLDNKNVIKNAFPHICDKVDAGIIDDGVISFIASNVHGFDFTDDKTLVTLSFKVTAPGVSVINSSIYDLLDNDNAMSKVYYNGTYFRSEIAPEEEVFYHDVKINSNQSAIKLGDTDGDGEVTIIDATVIQRHLASIPTSTYIEAAADADEDGSISIIDATYIQRWLAQLPTNNNIGKLIS